MLRLHSTPFLLDAAGKLALNVCVVGVSCPFNAIHIRVVPQPNADVAV